MKKLVFLSVAMMLTVMTFAQSEKYTKKMTELLSRIDSFNTVDQLNTMSASFERVGDAEKTQWLPYYYAALTKIDAVNMQIAGKMGGNTAVTDPAADAAEALVKKVLALTKENSEIWILNKMIASLRMMGDPMSRFMQYGPVAAEALATAKAMDANNPRAYILEGQDKFYTPEQFGGSKTEAKKLFEKATELFKTFKPETTLHPNWGMGQLMYFASQK
jgi:hypothetical protein